MPKEQENSRYGLWGLGLLLLIYAGAAYTLSPFTGPLLMGAVLTTVGWPWQLRLEKAFHLPRWLGSLIHAIAWIAIIIIPAVIIVDTILPKVALLIARWQSGNSLLMVPPEVMQIPYIGHWLRYHLSTLNGAYMSSFISSHASIITDSLSQLWIFTLHTFFAALTVFALALHGERITEALRLGTTQLWGRDRGDRFLTACRDAARSVLIGLIGVGVIEGMFIGIAYALAGLALWPLWLVATALISPLPFGATAVVGAATIWLAFTGHWIAGLAVLGWGFFVIIVADLVVRPLLTGSQTQAPFFLVFFSILGGAEAFGLIGLIIGPILVLLARGVWRAWERRIRLQE
ncbi:AI-2E family transporter [Acidithiobacillus marinus]|uniref:AI-2E family transporter n=1 Tax=Acidithiobacillus marinus TaxID=187490 RepID=A0A2I1DJC5_9PROT|nr:AI-2E family transporter [Acidithiobacillus marinus]PKY09980.1 AI-2E family transporter [Acidithiobacillus marinus]